jgi:ADP-heptose:LPS heptosyltransferase
MGMGDEIMASGQARRLRERFGRPAVIVDRRGNIRQNSIWDGNPNITYAPNHKTQKLLNGPGFRPYIEGKTQQFWVWKEWERLKGDIFLTNDERKFAADYAGCVLIEPNTKVMNGNKSWPWRKWQKLVDSSDPAIRFIQVGPAGTRTLAGVTHVETTFRKGCAILAAARCFIGTEGALHHAAAALSVPAVVLWSEFISPEYTGYESQRNIRHAGKACGSRVPCPSCAASMESISVAEVSQNLKELL